MALPDISLREFNTIATGKYNAGLIDFTTDAQGVTKLTKLNNHIKKIKLNGVKMTPERILEVKETFIKALQGSGLKNEDVSAIRAKLGIPDTLDADTSRETQSKVLLNRFRPLTRQEVREIIDQYANPGNAAARRPVPDEHKALADSTTAKAIYDGTAYDYTINHVIGFLTDTEFSRVNAARLNGIKGADVENAKQRSSDALRNQISMLFDAAMKLLDEDVREAGPLQLCGHTVRLVKNDNGSLIAKIGTGALETKIDLGADASLFLDKLINRAVRDVDFLGGAKVFKMLDEVFDRDASGIMTENDRTSRTRQFAAAVIAKKVGEDIGMQLLYGSMSHFNTGILVKIAEHALDGNDIKKEDLERLAEEFKKDVAQLPDDLKEMLAKVVQDRPVEIIKDDGTQFTVKDPIVGDIADIAKANIPKDQSLGEKPRDVSIAEIKDFVADLVFSDETLVADVTINRPGETMRKMLSDSKKLTAFAEILRTPALLDKALSPNIAGVVKEGFAKLSAALDADFKAANNGESLEQAAKKADFVNRFSLFLKDANACKGATLARFDDILLRMSKKGCEEIQSFINLTFKINGNVQNEAGGLTTEPYKDKTASQIKAELKAKSLNDIMDSAATDASVPGQVGFFKQILSDYFLQMSNADKRSVFASAMRYAETFDFAGKTGNELESASQAASAKFVGAILKGTGPLLQKMMQGIPRNVLAGFSDALADMKSNLSPIPRKIVQAHLYKMINDSKNTDHKIESITLEQSLGAASVGEAFLCKFTYLDDNGQEKTEKMVVKIMRHDAEARVEREAKLFEAAAIKIGPGMKKTWDGQYEQYKTEFDFRNEARNVEEGVKLYNVWKNPNHFARAITPNVASMKISPLAPPTKTAMVCTMAGEQNADQYFKEYIKQVQEACAGVFEQDPATGRLKWDPVTKKPIFKENINFAAMQEMMMFVNTNYNVILTGQKNLQQAAQLWFHEAFLGSGKFHGDAHAGNIMLEEHKATFIDYGNMFEFKIHYEKGPDGQPVMEEVTVTNDDGEKVKEMRPKVLLNERVELLRLILGATLRNKDFFLAGFEKLLSPAGKATLAANRDKAEAIVETILAKGKFSFDVCYRLQGALNELQKLGLEMPPQISCFVQSMTRLQNTMAEMNTILNQLRTVVNAVKNDIPKLPADAPQRDELDVVGKFNDMPRTEAGQKIERAYDDEGNEKGFVIGENGLPTEVPLMVPHYVKEMQHLDFNHEDYEKNGKFTLKVAERIKKAKNPVEEARRISNLLTAHFDIYQKQTYMTLVNFEKAYAEAKDDEKKNEVIDNFAFGYASSVCQQIRSKTYPTLQFFSNKLDMPGGFAGVVMTTLFAGSDAAEEMIDDNFSLGEKGKIMGSMKVISMKELGAGLFAGAQTIMNAIIDDTKKLGGDDSYQIDIGV